VKASNYLRDGFLLPKMKGFISIGFLILSNTFMTLAWYGHLKFKDLKGFENLGIISVVLISWGIALFEYFLQVPANRIGFREYGGPFSLLQLKVIQEVISITVFLIFALLFFKSEHLRLNHVIAFILLVIAVYLVFKK
jgi:uncharacterized protein (DUF486 family)